MSVRSKWLFILVGNNSTGKTTIQRIIVESLAGIHYQHLPSNNVYTITNEYMVRKFREVFVAGRSYQELRGPNGQYNTVEKYFQILDNAGPAVDLAFMASHLDAADIEMMVKEAHKRFWNVCGIFLSNSVSWQSQANADVSARQWWDERWLAENPPAENEQIQAQQLRHAAVTIVHMLIERTRSW